MLDFEEGKKLVLFALNYAMLGGSCLMKVPQISNILKAGSVVGLSETWVINECIAGLLWVYYNALVGHAFVTYGEAVMVGVQNVIIIAMYWHYSPELPKLPRIAGSIAFMVASVAVLALGLPSGALKVMGTSPIFLGNGAKVPQILKNSRQQHTGTLAIVPAFLGFAGNAVRVLTSFLQTPDDPVAILNPLMAAVLWFVLLAQFVLYYQGTKKLQEEAAAKKADGKKAK